MTNQGLSQRARTEPLDACLPRSRAHSASGAPALERLSGFAPVRHVWYNRDGCATPAVWGRMR